MDPAAIYAKTPKGVEEMQSRTYRLGLRARALLILVDGKSSAADVIEKGKAGGNSAAFAGLAELETQGFIAMAGSPREAASARSPEAVPPAQPREGVKSLAAVRRYAIERMNALSGPHGPAFVERLQSSADRATLVAMLERCRNAVQVNAGQAEADRFWAGVEERLP